MKKQVLYMCEYCGTQYKEEKDAAKCEKGHKNAKRICNSTHHAKGDYPDRIEVEFEDGTKIWYKK